MEEAHQGRGAELARLDVCREERLAREEPGEVAVLLYGLWPVVRQEDIRTGELCQVSGDRGALLSVEDVRGITCECCIPGCGRYFSSICRHTVLSPNALHDV